MSEQSLNFDSLELIRGDINGSYTTVYSSGDATLYKDIIVKYFCNFATPGAGKFKDSQPRSVIYTKTSLGNHVREPYVMLSMSGRQTSVARMASFDHIVAGKVGIKGSTTENFFRNLELFDGRMANESDFVRVNNTQSEPDWNRPILSGIKHNSNPAAPHGLLSKKQIAAILHNLFSCLESGRGRTNIKIVSDSIGDYEKRSMDILREIYCYLPYSLRSEIGFCSYAANENINMPTNIKLVLGEYEPDIWPTDEDSILLDDADIENYEPTETKYITSGILDLINFIVSEDSDRIDFFEFIENYIGIRSPNIFCSPTICAQMFGVYKEGKEKGTVEWLNDYLQLSRMADAEGSDSSAEERRWTVETWLLYKLRPNHADAYFEKNVEAFKGFSDLDNSIYDIKKVSALFKLQSDWAKEAPVPDYIPPEDYEPRADAYLHWIRGFYGTTEDEEHDSRLNALREAVYEVRESNLELSLPQKLYIDVDHEYEVSVEIPEKIAEIESIKEQAQAQFDRIKEQVNDRITQYETEIDQLNKEYSAEIESLNEGHAAEIEGLNGKYSAEIESLNEGHAAEIEGLNEKYSAEIESLNESHAAEIEGLNEKYSAEIESLNEKYAAEINQLNEEHAAEINRLNEEYTQQMESLRAKHIDEITQKNIEIDNLNSEIARLNAEIAKCNTELDKLNEEIAGKSTEIDKLKRDHENELKDKIANIARLENGLSNAEREIQRVKDEFSQLENKENYIRDNRSLKEKVVILEDELSASAKKVIIAAVAALVAGLLIMFVLTRFVFGWKAVEKNTMPVEPITVTETEPEVEPEVVTKAEPEAEPEVVTKVEPEVVTKAEPEAEPDSVTEAEPEVVTKAEPEVVTKDEPAPKPVEITEVEPREFEQSMPTESDKELELVGDDVLFAAGLPSTELSEMLSVAKDHDFNIETVRGYEPYDEENPSEEGRLLATGLVVELAPVEEIYASETDDTAEEAEKWLSENCYWYGFVEIGNGKFLYVGDDAAQFIKENNITVE